MKWILIAWFTMHGAGRAVTAIDVEFNTEEACQAAGELLASREHDWEGFVCVAKGKSID